MGGHRRIATGLFLRYAQRPELVAALLELDHDAANGGLRASREYAARWRLRRATVLELLRAYVAHAEALSAKRTLPRDRRQRALMLPYEGGVEGAQRRTIEGSGALRAVGNHFGNHLETGKASGIMDSPRDGNHLTGKTGTGPISLMREERDLRAHALPDPEGRESAALHSRRRAARLDLGIAPSRQAERASEIEVRAAELSELEVARILAKDAAERAERSSAERRRRTQESMRHEGRARR